MRFGVKLFTFAAALAAYNPLWAETFTYRATTDFTDINAGAAPYTIDTRRNALSINAAVLAYRNVFARATLEFPEEAGVYDITITALDENDGEGEYRFLVDGVVVGSAVNAPTQGNFAEQQHTFEGISIPEGALIGVESNAVSNGLIPENDEFAFARGRWTTLTLDDSDDDEVATPETSTPVDLSVTVTTSDSQVSPGTQITYNVVASNLSSTVATNPVVTLSFAEDLNNITSDSCTENSDTDFVCNLAELTPDGSTEFSITAVSDTTGSKEVTAQITADQVDDLEDNNIDSVTITVVNTIDTEDSVDLQLTFSADKEQLEVGEDLTYTLSVSNLHSTNTATSPVIGIALPDSLQFAASDTCRAIDDSITCDLEELSPSQTTTARFTATAINTNSFSQILAAVSSEQSETVATNNDSILVTRITTVTPENVVSVAEQESSAITAPSTEQSNSSGGGGSFLNLTLLIFLLQPLLFRQLTPFRSQKDNS